MLAPAIAALCNQAQLVELGTNASCMYMMQQYVETHSMRDDTTNQLMRFGTTPLIHGPLVYNLEVDRKRL